MIDATNAYGLYQRFYRLRPKRNQVRICWLSPAEYSTLAATPHFGISTFWQSYQAGITRLDGNWFVCLRPFGIAGEYPGHILLLPRP